MLGRTSRSEGAVAGGTAKQYRHGSSPSRISGWRAGFYGRQRRVLGQVGAPVNAAPVKKSGDCVSTPESRVGAHEFVTLQGGGHMKSLRSFAVTVGCALQPYDSPHTAQVDGLFLIQGDDVFNRTGHRRLVFSCEEHPRRTDVLGVASKGNSLNAGAYDGQWEMECESPRSSVFHEWRLSPLHIPRP